jgi:hypothetical protein
MQNARCFTAFFYAPLVVPLALICWLASTSNGLPASIAPFLVILATAIGYVGTILFGLPVYLAMRSSGMTSFLYAPIFGGFMGLLACFVGLAVFGFPHSGRTHTISSDNYSFILVCAGIGIAVGIVLWLIARPDLPMKRDVRSDGIGEREEV